MKPPAAADFLRHPKSQPHVHYQIHTTNRLFPWASTATLFANRHLPAFGPATGVGILLIGHLPPNIYDARDRISQKFDILGMVYPPILVSRYLDQDGLIYQPSCHFQFQFINQKTRPYRYVRLIVNIIGHCLYRSIPKPQNPTYTKEDVTVVIPTIESNLEELRGPISSILACDPHELILVTTFGKYHGLLQFAASFADPRIKVYDTKIANKRVQLREAIPRVTTRITVLVDDDVTWPTTILPWLLAPFEREDMGSVGVCQRVQRVRTGDLATRAWNWLGACYIHRRNFEISASHFYDGGTSCMSGRTNAVRTEILKHPLFLDGFCKERWGKYQLNADDDNFLTRWLVNHDWKTWIQYERECEIETTLENDWSFVRQCLRWARSNWRSNYTTLFIDRKVYW